MTAAPRPLLTFLPWLLASMAAHAVLLAQWQQGSASAEVVADVAGSTPLRVQLLRSSEPAQAAAPPARADTTMAHNLDSKPAPADNRVTAAARPVAVPARTTPRSMQRPTEPTRAPRAIVDAMQTAVSTTTISTQPVTAAVATRAPGDMERNGSTAGWTELMSLLHQAIDRHKRYPQSALYMGREGAARIDFSMGPDGRIDDLNIGISSGVHALDLAAYRAVQAVAPFTDATRYLERAQRFQVDVVFRIN